MEKNLQSRKKKEKKWKAKETREKKDPKEMLIF